MATKVFINLPVANLKRSMDFFSQLGYTFNMQFTDEKAACMVISENIFTMLLTQEYFTSFSKKPVPDTKTTAAVLIALDADSREAVRQTVDKAVSLGGKLYAEPQDHGWMYQHSFTDLDGHHWEYAYMDISLLPNFEEQEASSNSINASINS